MLINSCTQVLLDIAGDLAVVPKFSTRVLNLVLFSNTAVECLYTTAVYTTVELTGRELAHRARAAAARGIS